MSEDEIRRYLGRQPAEAPRNPVRIAKKPTGPGRSRRPGAPQESFRDFSASHLLCPKCQRAMPVRERLLLFLPDGDLYDYQCQACGSSCGTRKA